VKEGAEVTFSFTGVDRRIWSDDFGGKAKLSEVLPAERELVPFARPMVSSGQEKTAPLG